MELKVRFVSLEPLVFVVHPSGEYKAISKQFKIKIILYHCKKDID